MGSRRLNWFTDCLTLNTARSSNDLKIWPGQYLSYSIEVSPGDRSSLLTGRVK